MRFPLVSPAAIAELARSAVGQVVETAAFAATVPVRVIGLLGQTELLVSRVTMIADEAEGLIQRVAAAVDEVGMTVAEARTIAAAAAGVVGQATEVSTRAAAVVEQAEAAAVETGRMLDAYSPTLMKGAPLAQRFVDELSPEEVTAAIRMIDQLPALRAHLVDDVMPLLGKLDQVGPDLHKLLEVTEDLRLAIAGIPGLKLLRRRGEDREDRVEEESR